MATIRDVAERAGVSTGTVSNYLRDATALSAPTRRRVAQAIAKLRYQPNHAARSLRSKQSKIIGMVIPDITNPFFPQMMRGAEEAAARHGFILAAFNTDDRQDREATAIDSCLARGMDGLLLVVAPGSANTTRLQRAIRAGTAIVCLDRVPSNIAADCVLSDNRGGSRQCTLHLLALGHRRVAFVGGPRDLANSEDRRAGYHDALAHAGLTPDPSLIVDGDFRIEGGLRAGRELLALAERPTAVLVSNGMMALGVIRALEEAGLECPRDLALACFDELAIAGVFRPRLTTVVQPVYRMGQRGTELLIERITGSRSEPAGVRILLETELRVRESTTAQARP